MMPTSSRSKNTSEKPWKNLWIRFVSAISLAGFCIIPLYFGGILWALLATLFAVLMIKEWVAITDFNQTSLAFIIPALTVIVALYFIYKGQAGYAGLALLTGIVLTSFERVRRPKSMRGGLVWSNLVWSIFGLFYIIAPTAFMIALRGRDVGIFTYGFTLVMFIILSVVAADVGAYFGGSYFKGPKLVPRLSPNKTWSGAASGLLAGICMGAICANVMEFSVGKGIIMAIVIVILSVLGDILESAIKRRLQVKDAGNMLPGHGGVLDRLDSLLFTIFIFGAAVLKWPEIWPVYF